MRNRFNAIILAFLAVTVLVSSCTKDKDQAAPPVIGFSQESFAVDFDNEATLQVVSTEAFSEAQSVTFTVSGNLTEGVDYELSADQFHFASGSREATVTVRILKEISDQDVLEFTLNPVGFGTLGLSKANVGITIGDVVLYSFDKSNYTMTQSVDVTLQLSKATGSFTAEQEMTFGVEVDTENSTAVEGVHFSFAEGKTITIPAGQNKGTIKLNLIKQEAGKDRVVLRLTGLPIVFKPGDYDQASVVVFGPTFEKLEGTWKYVAMTNKEWWETNNSYMGDDMSLLPTNNTAEDLLIFDETGLKIEMEGDLKNYFRESVITYVGEEEERLQEAGGINPPRVTIDLISSLVNVNFSATQKNERQAEVGYRVFEEGGKEILEVTIRDYEPTDFLQNIFDAFNQPWNTDVPLMKTMPLRFHFERVN